MGLKMMELSKLEVLEVRRRDTPKFVYDAQIEMINVLSSAEILKILLKKFLML